MATTIIDAEPTSLERALRIRRGERRMVGRLVALFMVIQANHAFGANAADALFFQRFGVDQLPLMILLSGPAVMVSVLGHGSGLAARGTARWLPGVTLACAVWAGAEWAGILTGSREIYPVIWISTQMIMMVTLTVMWNAAGASCTSRQAKRLFPIFATAGIAGGVLGNLLTGTLAGLLGTDSLLLVQAGLLLTGAFLLTRSRELFGSDDMADPPRSTLKGLSETMKIIRSSRFLTITAGIAVAVFCLFHLVYFPFSETVAESFATEAETAAFLGIFSSIATAATFLFSLFVTNRLFSKLGLVVSLMIVPIVYAAGFGTWLTVYTLESAAIVRGVQWVTVNAIALTAYNALFNVVSRQRRGQVNAFMTAVPAQIGVSLAGLLLLVTAAMPIQAVFVVGLVVSLVTLGAVIVLRKEYLNAVVSAVRQGVIGLFDTPSRTVFTPTDADAVRVLKDRLRDPRPAARALAVAGLGRLGGSDDAADLEPFLADSDPRVRSAAFDSVCAIEPERVSSHASSAIDDEVPEVRLQVVHFLTSRGDETASIARPALTDPDVRVRAAAATLVGGREGEEVISALLAEDEPAGVTAVLTETAKDTSSVVVDPGPFLSHRSPLVREAATRAALASDVEPAALRPGLDDRSPRVRAATAATLAASPQGREVLVDVLATGSVSASESALRALTPLDELPEQLTDWARHEAERAAYLISHARALGQSEPTLPAGRFLINVLEARSRRLVQWVLMAMTIKETMAIMPLVARGVESSDPDTQSQAIEALESIGARDVMVVLLPLLESEDTSRLTDVDRTLQELATDFDPWLRALAVLTIGEIENGDDVFVPSLSPMDEGMTQSILDTVDRVLVLQRVHMFSELDPEDLGLIAQAAAEKTYEPGAPVFVAGEAGDGMTVIVEGSAVVTVDEGSTTRLIKEYGPGDHVGELALLTGGLRSADVHAGDDGLRGLSLTATDLLTVLEERPTVAVGMLATLARRLIEQT